MILLEEINLNIVYDKYIITDEKDKMQLDIIVEMLHETYWAKYWSKETIKKAFDNSLCFGVFSEGKQIAYARCVTDYATMYWLCDVVVASEYRNKGIGKNMINFIVSHEKLSSFIGILSSNHYKELYKMFGFKLSTNGFMIKSKKNRK